MSFRLLRLLHMNDRNLLLRSGHQESKNSRNSHRSARRREPKAGAGQANRPPLFLRATISDNQLYVNLKLVFRVERDVASIWERVRVFTLRLGS